MTLVFGEALSLTYHVLGLVHLLSTAGNPAMRGFHYPFIIIVLVTRQHESDSITSYM